MFVACLWRVCGVFVACLWCVCGVFVACLWRVCGVFVACLWRVCGISRTIRIKLYILSIFVSMVRQQLDSFDEFIMNTMQEIVEDSQDIVVLGEPEIQDDSGEDVVCVLFCWTDAHNTHTTRTTRTQHAHNTHKTRTKHAQNTHKTCTQDAHNTRTTRILSTGGLISQIEKKNPGITTSSCFCLVLKNWVF